MRLSRPFAEPPATRLWQAGSRRGRVWSCAALMAAKSRIAASISFAHEFVASPLDHPQLSQDLFRDQPGVDVVNAVSDLRLELGHGQILVGGCRFFFGQ